MKTSFIRCLVALTHLAYLAGCAGGTKGIKVGPGQGAAAKEQTQTEVGPGKASDAIGKDAKLLHATFDINVTSLFGIQICTGDMEMQINAALKKEDSAQLFEVPSGKVKCAIFGEIDLAQALGGYAGTQEPVKDPLEVKNDVIHLKQVGLGIYTPARPMMPSFIASSKEKLAALDYTRSVTVKQEDGKTASGNVTIKTLAFGASHKPPRMDRTFNNVINFEVVNEGFDGIDRVTNLLFDRMEFKISLNPLSILYVDFRGKIADYLDAAKNAPGGGGADPLAGIGGGGPLGGLFGMIVQGLVQVIDVELEMDLVTQDGLDKIAEEGSDGGSDGEQIGGKSSATNNSGGGSNDKDEDN